MDFSHISLCPLDDRYARRVDELREVFTEPALIQARAQVEVEYLIALSDAKGVEELPPFSEEERTNLRDIIVSFSDGDLLAIRQKEKQINHDVKSIEYWLREKCLQLRGDFPIQFIRFGMTSEDDTNLAYGLLIKRALREVIAPNLRKVSSALTIFAHAHGDTQLLGMTHGQAATPLNIKDIIANFTERLELGPAEDIRDFKMNGKFGGAVGNFAAHKAAYPEVDWQQFGRTFVRALGLKPIYYTKQINSHDDLARLSHLMIEVNTILLDLARDMWLYISRGVFCEQAKAGEVGSSTMPNKVNPLDWENAEGNLGISTALFSHFAQKLPVSRMQRDLSDSTVQRWVGCAFGAHLLAVKSCLKGLGKLQVNEHIIQEELAQHPEVYAEAIQTVMRRFGYTDAYEQLKKLTRGKEVTRSLLIQFTWGLERIPGAEREKLVDQISQYQRT